MAQNKEEIIQPGCNPEVLRKDWRAHANAKARNMLGGSTAWGCAPASQCFVFCVFRACRRTAKLPTGNECCYRLSTGKHIEQVVLPVFIAPFARQIFLSVGLPFVLVVLPCCCFLSLFILLQRPAAPISATASYRISYEEDAMNAKSGKASTPTPINTETQKVTSQVE